MQNAGSESTGSQSESQTNSEQDCGGLAGGVAAMLAMLAMPDRRDDGDELAGALAVFAPDRHLLWLELPLPFRIIVPP